MSLYLGSEKVENVTAQITLPVEPSDDLPLADGTASAGVSKKFSRADHVHPMETVEATLVDLPSAEELGAIPAPTSGITGQVLTKTASGQKWADVTSPKPSTMTPLAPTEVGSVGTSTAYARGDHIHPSDSTKLDKTNPSAIGSFIIEDLDVHSGIQLTQGQAQSIVFGSPGPTIFVKADTITNPNVSSNIGVILPTRDSEGNFAPTVRIDRIIEPITDTMPTTKKYVDDLSPKARKITLATSGWSNNQQSVTCTGVSASATSQEIRVMPADASKTSAYVSCGVSCIAQAKDKLTFACDKVPTTAIDVYVVMQSLNFQS